MKMTLFIRDIKRSFRQPFCHRFFLDRATRGTYHFVVKTIIYLACAGVLTAGSAWGSTDADSGNLYVPKPLDGVVIEAVETYPNPLDHELGLGVGLYPFNAYYSGI